MAIFAIYKYRIDKKNEEQKELFGDPEEESSKELKALFEDFGYAID